MKVPWLQVEREAFTKAEVLQNLLEGPSYNECLGLLVRLWRYACTIGRSEEAPTGMVDGPRAGRMLCAAVGWTGPEEVFLAALVEVGFLERTETGIRIRGASRYAKNWRRNHNLPAQAELLRSDCAVTVQQTKTETETEKKTKKKKTDAGGEPPTPGFKELVQSMVDDFAATHGVPYAFQPKDGVALSKLRTMKPTPPDSYIRAVWRHSLVEWPRVGSISSLLSRWNDCTASYSKPEGPRRVNGMLSVDRPRPR